MQNMNENNNIANVPCAVCGDVSTQEITADYVDSTIYLCADCDDWISIDTMCLLLEAADAGH